ncbi:MAG TPA: fibronectin type III domain-containing protein, partial [Tepidisphaeraceae bacterium]|nr:fibronectin type III domain-containing protein [Tepidisphaeraceae bacterium]
SFSNFDYQDNIYLFTNIKPVTGPTAVVGASVNPSSAGNVLTWTANTEGNLDGYSIYRSTTSNGTYQLLNAEPTSLTTFTDTTALVGQQYFYRVRAIDLHGTESVVGTTVNTTRTTDNVAPSAPTYPTAIGSTNGITLNWLDNSEPDLAGYNVFRSSSSNGTYTQLNEDILTSSTYLDTTAPLGTTSYYRIVAIDLTGNVSASAQTSAMRPANPNVPVAPSNLLASAVTSSSINLSWADNSSNETSFILERRTIASNTFETLVTLPADTTSYNNTGLSEDTTYIYRIRAINSSGTSVFSNEVTATTQVSLPDAPSGLHALAMSKSAVKLTWFDNADNESGYRIERQIGSGTWTVLTTVGESATRFIDGSVAAGVTYTYRVRAINAGGESENSNTSTVTTPVRAEYFTGVNIGAPLGGGDTSVVTSGRDYTITAGGTDVWNKSDQFRFVYKSITGDFDYSVRVAGLTQADARSMAGLMARETLSATSKNAFMRVRANDVARFAWRNATAGTTSATGSATGAAPDQFVRLTRSGNVFTGYFSADGVTWSEIGSTTISMPSTIYFGMAASARSSNGLMTTATFTELTDRLAASTPSAPTDVSAIVDPAPRITINWQDTSTNETGFRVERQTGSNAWQSLATLASDVNSFTDTGLSLDGTYSYRIIALNSAGDSPASSAISVTVRSRLRSGISSRP